MGSIIEAIFRFSSASLLDSCSFKRVYALCLLLQMCLAGIMYFTINHNSIYTIFSLLGHGLISAHFSIFLTVCGQIFGLYTGPKIYGVLSLALGLSYLGASLSSHFIGFQLSIFLVASGFSAIALGLLFCFREQFSHRRVKYLLL